MKSLVLSAAVVALMGAPALAQEDAPASGWTGEGSVTAGVTTGNTETTDLGVGIDVGREAGVWAFGVLATADYGETDGEETRNRFFLGGNVDRQLNDRLFAFGQASYEKDDFSGFDSRAFVGGGLGYDILVGEQTTWSVRGGPGIKIDEIKAIESEDEFGNPLIIPAMTEESVSATFSSDFDYAFNDNVKFTNDTSALYAETSTQIGNIAALTASLTNALSARISLEVRHDTDPPLGFEATDTATRFSLVYGFGK